MARIAGVDLPQVKRVEIALTYIHGIGRTRSGKILEKAGVDLNIKVKDLSEDETSRIRKVIQDEGRVEGDLRKDVSMNLKRLMEIGCYRGIRHRRSMPVRGSPGTSSPHCLGIERVQIVCRQRIRCLVQDVPPAHPRRRDRAQSRDGRSLGY